MNGCRICTRWRTGGRKAHWLKRWNHRRALRDDHTPRIVLGYVALLTVLSVKIPDRETQQPAGMLIVGHAEPRKWTPNETYFLQAIGDQMLMSVSHTRLRSLVRR